MRAHFLVFFAAAFEADLATDGAPTFDPEESDIVLLDEYMTDALPDARSLQMINGTNYTIPSPHPALPDIPIIPAALVLIGGAAVAGYFLCSGGHTYETYSYDHAAESGLLDHPDYEVHDMDESDEYYE